MPVISFVDANKPGTIIPFAGDLTKIPDGYLYCNGDAVSRETYGRLYSIVLDSWGAGDGLNTFNLPDLRGRFMRGVDNGAGRDPDSGSRDFSNTGGNTGDNVGSVQGESFLSHNHGGGDHDHDIDATSGNIVATQGTGASTSGTAAGFGGATTNNAVITKTSGNVVNSEGGNETRPVNAGVHFIIKF